MPGHIIKNLIDRFEFRDVCFVFSFPGNDFPELLRYLVIFNIFPDSLIQEHFRMSKHLLGAQKKMIQQIRKLASVIKRNGRIIGCFLKELEPFQ